MRTLPNRILIAVACLAAFVSGASAPAAATSIVDLGETTVEVTSIAVIGGFVAEVGDGAQLGTLFDRTFLEFPVTAVSLVAGTIDHGGFVRLSNGGADLSVGNFRIDLPQSTLFAQVNQSGGVDFPLFALQDCEFILGACQTLDGKIILDGIGLFLTDDAVTALNGIGIDVSSELPSGQFGVASSTIIPEPAVALLTLGGLAGLGHLGRRRGA